jgi:hypothetical protein
MDVKWIHLAEKRDQWQALLNMLMNFWVPQYMWVSLLAQEVLAFWGVSFIEYLLYSHMKFG